MKALYVTSLGEATGKSALCAGIGHYLRGQGRQVGYLKPVAVASEAAGAAQDAAFFIKIFQLDEPPDKLCPLSLEELGTALAHPESQAPRKLMSSYSEVAVDKDTVLLEGLGGLLTDGQRTQAEAQAARLLEAKVVAIHRYGHDFDRASNLLTKAFGDSLLGVVINMVPPPKLEVVRDSEPARWETKGIKLLGALPQDRRLMTISCAELAHELEGEVLNPTEKLEGLVENVMVGAFTVDPGPLYYGRKGNKAVIAPLHRADMQMAALDTPTHCLILSGQGQPTGMTLSRAQDAGVPLILTERDTLSIINVIEQNLSRARFRQEAKLEPMAKLLEESLDLAALGWG
ncbi:MAG TPA: phosphotransacetylase family protein [Dehalococcoidia bacterium]|jgi:hypothetical protein|nr:phosphotransacetylase family protein [Dehalococcoidia bacterium]